MAKTEPHYFFVTSYGRTATVWLTSALNLHTQVACSHSGSFEPITVQEGEKQDAESVIRSQQLSAEICAKSLGDITQYMNTQTKPPVPSGALRRWLHTLSSIGKRKHKEEECWVGNVHAFTAWNLEQKRKEDPTAPPYRTVNLLRHPITRIDSFWRRWAYEGTFEGPTARWIMHESLKSERYQQVLQEVRTKHDLPMESYSDRAFFHAVMQMSTDHGDRGVDVPHIVSERLVADIDYFAYVLRLLMGESFPLHSAYLRSVQELGKQNAAAGGGKSAIQAYEEWKPWQRTHYQIMMRDHEELRTWYPVLGYDILFAGFPAPQATLAIN